MPRRNYKFPLIYPRRHKLGECFQANFDCAGWDRAICIVVILMVCAGGSSNPLVLTGCGGVFQPPKLARKKCGLRIDGIDRRRTNSVQFRYYLCAIMFLILTSGGFLVPFAVAFTSLPVGAFIAILIFLLLLIEGLVWAWGKGCLTWQS